MILLPPAVSCRICILKGQDTANVQAGIRTVFIFQLSGTSKPAAAVEFADIVDWVKESRALGARCTCTKSAFLSRISALQLYAQRADT